MAIYHYQAKNFAGKIINGKQEASSEDELVLKLHDHGLYVISSKKEKESSDNENGEGKGGPLSKLVTLFKSMGIKLDEILLFTNQLAAMFGAGIPLLKILNSLSKEITNKSFRNILNNVSRDVEDGMDFSGALGKNPAAFDTLYVSLARAGEASGKLDTILTQLALYLDKSASLRRKVKAATAYPLIVTIFAIGILTFIVGFIVPKFEEIFKGNKMELPLPTKILINTVNAIRSHFIIAFILFIGFIILSIILANTNRGRFLFDKYKLGFPLFGKLIRKAIFARFCRTFGVLVSSGLPVLESLEIVQSTVNNKFIEQAINESAVKIEKGATITEAFKESNIFPQLILQMTSAGEESGHLDNMVIKAAEFYESQVEAAVTAITSIIEPVLIVILGVIIGGIVIAMFLPIFQWGNLPGV
ncbi:MAG: type II secretion system F family protein [bacterium]